MYQDKPCICIPFLNNYNIHPSDASLVGMFLYFLDGSEVTLNFTHPDVKESGINPDDIVLHKKSLVFDKKAMLYLGYDYGIDLNSYHD